MPLVLLLLLVLAAPAAAAPTAGPVVAHAVAADGTTVSARMRYAETPKRPVLSASVNDGPWKVLEPAGTYPVFSVPIVAAAPGGRAIVAWAVKIRGGDDFATKTRYAIARGDGSWSSKSFFSDGIPKRLVMNASGEAALLVTTAGFGPATDRVGYAPPDGLFGAPLDPPDRHGPLDIALTPSGQTLMLATVPLASDNPTATGLDVLTRQGDGPFSAPDRLADEFPYNAMIGTDGAGRALAVWLSGVGGARLRGVFRSSDGTWGAQLTLIDVPGPSLSLRTFPDLDVAPDGTAIVAADGQTSELVDGAAEFEVKAATGSLADGAFAPAVTLDTIPFRLGTPATPYVQAEARNGGGSTVTWSEPISHELRSTQGSGSAFGPATTSCEFGKAGPPCETPVPPGLAYSHRPRVGKNVRLTLTASPDSRISQVRWRFHGGKILRGNHVHHTFRRAGAEFVAVTAVIDGAFTKSNFELRVL